MAAARTRVDATGLAARALAALWWIAMASGAGAQQLLQPQSEANRSVPRQAGGTGDGVEWQEGPYHVHVRFQGGRVREVTIRPASASTPGPKPDWALINRFAPAGIDPNRPTRAKDERDPQSYLLFSKREWDVPGGQIFLTINVVGKHSLYKQDGDLHQASWWTNGNPVIPSAPRPSAPPAVVNVPGRYAAPDGQPVQFVGFSDQRWRGFFSGADARVGNESVRIEFAAAGPNVHNGEVYTESGWQRARFTRTPTGIVADFQDGRRSEFVRRGP